MFEILYADDVAEELQRLHASDRSIVVDRIKKQLRYEPAKATRAKKANFWFEVTVVGRATNLAIASRPASHLLRRG